MARWIRLVGFVGLASWGCASSQARSSAAAPQSPAGLAVPVAVFTGTPPAQGIEIGAVTVTAAGADARAEELLPRFVQRVSELGGNAAVVDGVRTRLEKVHYLRPSPGVCGTRGVVGVCRPFRAEAAVTIVIMRGRAFSIAGVPSSGATTPPAGVDGARAIGLGERSRL